MSEIAGQARGANADDSEHELSEREIEVLRLLTQGMTNKEIGHKLHLAENTVKNHLKNILEKLQVQNRVQAAAFALKKGIGLDHDPAE